MTVQVQAPKTMEELVERYASAWGEHDLEAILSLHIPNSGFTVHGANGIMVDAQGIDACREAFRMLLEAIPDQRFDTTVVAIKEDFYVCHHNTSGTLATPFELDGTVYEAIGTQIECGLVDIVECEGHLIKQKTSWLDGLAFYHQLEAAATT